MANNSSLFELDANQNVVFAPQALTIKEFKKLWDRDKTDDKRRAVKELSYVYFLCDYSSVYQNYPEEDREEALKQDLGFKDKWKPDKFVKAAEERFKELHTPYSMRVLEDAKFAVDKIRRYNRNIDLTKTDPRTGKPVYDIRKIQHNLENLGKLMESLEKLEEKVKKDKMQDSKIKGQRTKGAFEDA